MTSIQQLDRNFTPIPADDGSDGSVDWYDAQDIGIGGKGWANTTAPYQRFPTHAKNMVIPGAWTLSRCSTGLYIRFVTTAGHINCKWKLRTYNLDMAHMPATGVAGVDLYARDRGRLRFVGNGSPATKDNSALLCNLPEAPDGREYCLYLPLYNGTDDVRIGVPRGAVIKSAPPWPGESRTKKPILVYGTSITQGGCASRPGMCYTSIIGRILDRDIINLGFSGNGPIYSDVMQLLAEVDAGVFVMDGLANSTIQSTRNETFAAIQKYRELRPDVPIVIPESAQSCNIVQGHENLGTTPRNSALRRQFARLIDAGVANLHYIPGSAQTCPHFESTVDAGHPNDIGFLQIARAIAPVLRNLG